MEMLILFGIVGVPLFALALFAMHKERQEERKEKEAELQAQNP
jgi:hypothetical protein